MRHVTGLAKDEIIDLCVMVRSAELEPGFNHWPPILGLYESMVSRWHIFAVIGFRWNWRRRTACLSRRSAARSRE